LISLAAGYLGQTAHTLGRFTEVPDLLREGLQAAAETNDRFAIALAGVRMALAAQTRGNGPEARRHLQESIQHFREAGDTWFLSHALNLEGRIALASGELRQAQESFRESGKVALAAQAFPMLLDALTGLAMVDAQQDQQQRALVSIMHILENPSSTQDTKNRSEKLWADLSTQLSQEQVEWARAQVQNTSFEALVQERLLS
jgi:tetratricopeptide (TPR) repeat protein